MRLLILIVLPIVAGLIAYCLPKIKGKTSAIAIQCVSMALSLYNFYDVSQKGAYELVVGGYEHMAGISLRADMLASAMILLTVFTFLLCIIFAMNNERLESHFFFLYLVLQSCMIALFLSRDLFNIFVIIEVCTIIVAILIMYKNTHSLYDSLIYLMNNTAAMCFFGMGISILYRNLKSLNLDILIERMGSTELAGSYMLAYAMLLTGIGFKCALMPMFSWLPRAHAAKGVPTSVSAILSGLYIKTGVFVFIRLRELFLPIINIDSYLLLVAVITSLVGVRLAIKQSNIKLILAYHTISQVGLIMVGLLIGSYDSYTGGVYHIINHAVFKSTLFLCAGIYMDYYGHKNIKEMKGAFKNLPVVSAACLFAVFGITGAPFFNGSISKYFIQYGAKGSMVEYAIILINAGTIVSFLKFFSMMPGEMTTPAATHRECRYRMTAVTILGVTCLLGGVLAHQVMKVVFDFKSLVDPVLYMKKSVSYFMSLGFCWTLYKNGRLDFLTSDSRRSMSLSFNGISIMTCTFFMVTTMAIYFTNTLQ